ncbi:uncharacterized protein METZ01_LOCUS78651 [marine metagenome]|uniref:Uncharacterized protein n=1 Tax=marine metagenome TaxID=408172 RepID=A0A381UEN6_9ZZZZ
MQNSVYKKGWRVITLATPAAEPEPSRLRLGKKRPILPVEPSQAPSRLELS